MIDFSVVKIPEKFRNHPLFTEPICGMNFGFMAKRGYYETEESLRQPELMAKAGVNWVTLNMNFCLENWASRNLYLDFEFSTGELELAEMVRRMHEKGIHVLFKPCMTPLDGMWMGSVDYPEGFQIQGVHVDYWQEFFRSFNRAECYFASLAQKLGMDAMLIGAEYRGTEKCESQWREVIRLIRERFDGPISYEFTPESCNHSSLAWFEDLDFLSYSYYPPAAPRTGAAKDSPDYTREQIEQYLSSRRDTVIWLSENFGNKPVVFTEYGVRSAHGCIMCPYDFLWETYYDGQQQADFMEASFNTFWSLPQWMGLFWWKWDETQDRPHYKDPAGDKGFTIQGKPAEKVLQRWFKEHKDDAK